MFARCVVFSVFVRLPSQADDLERELRLDQITERPFAVLIFVLIFMLTYFVYVAGILSIEQLRCQASES